jgi:hypothetical protein
MPYSSLGAVVCCMYPNYIILKLRSGRSGEEVMAHMRGMGRNTKDASSINTLQKQLGDAELHQIAGSETAQPHP